MSPSLAAAERTTSSSCPARSYIRRALRAMRRSWPSAVAPFELLAKPGLPLHLARFPAPDGRLNRRLEQVALVGKHLIDGRYCDSRLGGDARCAPS